MKRLFLLPFIQLFIGLSILCKAENQKLLETMIENAKFVNGNKILIKIGEKTFTATILDNPTAKAFKALLPLTLNMDELNNNEKFAQLPKSVPTNASILSSIQSGDLVMYCSTTFVLFYKSISNSYSYSKIGKIDDVTGLMAALGGGDIKVSFVLKKD